MRKIESFVIGALVAGSRAPTASNKATLPWRPTSRIAPGMTPFSTSPRSVAVILLSRSVDSPTCSGVATGRLWASATTAPGRYSSATRTAIRILIGRLLEHTSSSRQVQDKPKANQAGQNQVDGHEVAQQSWN